MRSSIPTIRLYSLRVAVMSNMRLASSGRTLTELRDEGRSSPNGGPPGERDAGSTGRGGCAKGSEPPTVPERPGSTRVGAPDDGGRSSGRGSLVVRASPPLPVPGRVVAAPPPP